MAAGKGVAAHSQWLKLGGAMRLQNIASVLCAYILLAAPSFAAGADSANDRKFYKWVDEQGEVHYGDRIPPEYAGKEQHIINSQGIETQRIDAQRSADEVAAEEQQRQDAEQRARRDRNLLNTYGSVAEIERLRDQRLTLLSDQIKVTGQFLEILDGRMKKLLAASMRFKPYSADPKAPPMSDQVAEDLVRVGNDMRTQEENLREKHSEDVNMRREFDSDIERFKELKGIH
jgi:hypothetical protein